MVLGTLAGMGFRRKRPGGGGGDGPSLPPAAVPPELADRYQAFISLLGANNRALEIMAELQARVRGEVELSTEYVQTSVDELALQVGAIVAALAQMSPESAQGLSEVYEDLVGGIRLRLSSRRAIPEAELVLPFTAIGPDMEEVVGGKAAHLGEMASQLGLPVPPGFAITTYAFKRFLDHNGLWERIHEVMARSCLDEPQGVLDACRSVEDLIGQGQMPLELERAMQGALAPLLRAHPLATGVAVRSSAVMEDTSAGFAGQYQTALNVAPSALAGHYRRVIASQFSPHVVSYRHQRGLGLEDVAMAVAVMLMIPAQASGVLYTCNPNDPEQKAMMISAVRGLGARAVGGQMPTSLYLVDKAPMAAVLREEIIGQETMTVCLAGGGVAEVPVPPQEQEEPILGPAHLRALAGLGLRLEEHYGRPVDVEWALGPDGQMYLLQARGLRIIAKGIKPADYDRLVAGHPVLLSGGLTASPGVAAGPVVQVQTSSDLAKVTPGCVLVAQSSLPEYSLFLDQAAALVTEVGAVASHLASVARERRVPAVFAAQGARQVLAVGQPVTVDADRGVIYQGRIQALVALQKKRFLALAETQAYHNLERVLSRIIPLNLTDPRLPEFSPAGCRSLHDITRYCHEMAMQGMFHYAEACLDQTGGDVCLTQGSARRLTADFPLELYLIDLGGGIRQGAPASTVGEDDIVSLPMLGLLRGIHSVEWRGPGAVEAHTLAKSLAERGEGQHSGLAFRHNYVLLGREYMNLSTRLGFHYSTLDAYCSATDGDNYIRMAFMRGGADPARRARRARYIGTILERSGFWVEVKEDNVFARMEKYPAELLLAKLQVIGRLIVGTRQMDMVMFNDTVVDWYIEEFMKGEGSPSLSG
ncbi:MAG: hypothetical protein HY910_15115 [Desulfarculus sp.]|nr:hypothetical protein [Desulfarculus sp.]